MRRKIEIEPVKMTAIEKAQAARRANIEAGGSIVRLSPIERAKQKPKSRTLAIKAKCWDCCGAGHDPGIKEAIRGCTSKETCPLWPFRPYQRKLAKEE